MAFARVATKTTSRKSYVHHEIKLCFIIGY